MVFAGILRTLFFGVSLHIESHQGHHESRVYLHAPTLADTHGFHLLYGRPKVARLKSDGYSLVGTAP